MGITAGHGNALAVVRATSYFNGNSDFRGIDPTKTGGARELKIGTIDYFGPLTPYAKWGDTAISGCFPAEGQHITLLSFYFFVY